PGTELRHRRENSLQRWSLCCSRFQPEVLKKIPHRILRFSDSIRYQNKAISGIELAPRALKRCVGQQAHWNVSMRRPYYFPATDQQRLHVAAVHILEIAVPPQPRQQHGGIFLSHQLLREE